MKSIFRSLYLNSIVDLMRADTFLVKQGGVCCSSIIFYEFTHLPCGTPHATEPSFHSIALSPTQRQEMRKNSVRFSFVLSSNGQMHHFGRQVSAPKS